MKKNKIIYWTATSFIFLLEGVLPALTSQTEAAKQAIQHFGYPIYFGNMLFVFKALGALALILPQVNRRIKEWAYAGFAIDFIAASVSHWAVDGFGFNAIFALVILGILALSYVYLDKINDKSKLPLYAGN
jgi:hypothetical protein